MGLDGGYSVLGVPWQNKEQQMLQNNVQYGKTKKKK